MLSPKQLAYRREATHRWNVKTGATRSGKTYGDLFLLPKRLLAGRGRPGLNLLLGNTKGTLQRNIIRPLQELYGPGLVSDVRCDNTATLFGESAFCLGADSARQVDRLRGSSLKYCYGDEVTTWHPEVFQMLKSRLDKPYSLFDGTCNPAGPRHWFKEFLDGGADVYQQSYTIQDNPYLDAAFVDNLKREYQGTVYYQRYIQGLWVAAEGAVYRAFADDPRPYLTPEGWLEAHPPALTAIGVDFGGNGSGHAFCCTGFGPGFRDMAVLQEWYHRGEITPDALESAFVAFAGLCRRRYGACAAYCDNAEPTLIQGLRAACLREGLPVAVLKARKRPVNDRIRFLCRMMAAGRFFIHPQCPVTRQALASALWDSRTLTGDKRLDNGSTNIDSLDALEYSFEAYMDLMNCQGGTP